jgi:hypothetical protein
VHQEAKPAREVIRDARIGAEEHNTHRLIGMSVVELYTTG